MHPNRLLRTSFTVLAMATCGVMASVAIAQDPAGAAEDVWVQGVAMEQQPVSRVGGDQAMDGAVAAAVIGAIATEFDERQVQVRLDAVSVEPASLVDRRVSGAGRLRIGDDHHWIPFSFQTTYNTRDERAFSPRLELGGDPTVDVLPPGSGIASELVAEVGKQLDAEFADQSVELAATRVTATDLGTRYRKVEAVGAADFAAEGRTRARVEALYDRQTGEWLRVRYELGPSANWAGETDTPEHAVAVR